MATTYITRKIIQETILKLREKYQKEPAKLKFIDAHVLLFIRSPKTRRKDFDEMLLNLENWREDNPFHNV